MKTEITMSRMRLTLKSTLHGPETDWYVLFFLVLRNRQKPQPFLWNISHSYYFFLNIGLFIKNGMYYFKIVEDTHLSSAVYIKNTNRQLYQYLLNKADT